MAPAPVPEATLVENLCVSGDLIPTLSLVATAAATAADEAGRGAASTAVVGHVACSMGRVAGGASWMTGNAGPGIVGLAPLGVLPEFQGRGVGSALMHAVLGAADALGAVAVVLLGDPGFYRRFGFEPAALYGVLPPVAEWAPHFQLRRLSAWPVAGDCGGTFHYAPAFDAL